VSFQSFALPEFWKCYESLPANVRVLADARFALFQSEPFYPSLSLKPKGEVWTADIGRWYRAIATAKATTSIGSGSALTRPTTICFLDLRR